MKEYGYMENGYLRSRFIEPIRQGDKIITEDEQIAQLSKEWKPVDPIDTSRVENAQLGYVVIPMPQDYGDHIGYEYVSRFDVQAVRTEIQTLKDCLSDSDYKITKCYEASLLGDDLPYDIAELHRQRQAYRDKINDLESIEGVQNG